MNNYFLRMTFLQPTLLPLKTYSTLAKPYKGYERSKRETCSQARLIMVLGLSGVQFGL